MSGRSTREGRTKKRTPLEGGVRFRSKQSSDESAYIPPVPEVPLVSLPVPVPVPVSVPVPVPVVPESVLIESVLVPVGCFFFIFAFFLRFKSSEPEDVVPLYVSLESLDESIVESSGEVDVPLVVSSE